jgi:hypothetical protein
MLRKIDLSVETDSIKNIELSYMIYIIGMNFGKYSKVSGKTFKEYQKGGIKFIASKLGTHQEQLVKSVLWGKRKNGKVMWCFSNRYPHVYHVIIRWLKKCIQKREICDKLNSFYITNKMQKNGKGEIVFPNLKEMTASALICPEKIELLRSSVDLELKENIRKELGRRNTAIETFDKPLDFWR